MNKIILIGNLTRDPESSTTQGGVNFTRFNIAVNRPFTNAAGERVADYFDVICWRQLAERCGKYLFKGSKVGVNGSVQRRQYEDRDGVTHTSFDVVADEVEFLTPRQPQAQTDHDTRTAHDNNSAMAGMTEVSNDDLPF